ncbi:MAG: FtsQ-type POTRA domain-containing protein [Alphaproteobacteria bacterium]|nr:FtsQ-type POTRA domain-containing protein [Alphaproteobacteria bacterium]
MRLIPSLSKRKKVTRRKPISRLKRRRIAVGVVVIAFGGGLVGAVWSAVQTGWLETQMEIAENRVMEATAGAGLAVREVLVRGRQITARDDLIAALDIHSGMPILAIEMEEARQRVESLGWVKSVTIARRLPDTIYVQIEERKALALWQHKGRITLIDREGAVIQRRKLEGFAALPLVVGEDAPANAASLLDLLRTYPAVSGQVEAAVRVSGRRWNLRLRNGIDIRLPAEDVATALDRLAEYQREHALFERDVIAVDLRVPDRLIVRVTGKAAERARATGENT